MRTVRRYAFLGCSSLIALALHAGACSDDGENGTNPPGAEAGAIDGPIGGEDSLNTEDGALPDQAVPDADLDAGPKCKTADCALSLAAGPFHTCALLGDHTVKCWGDNPHGELGSGAVEGGTVNPKTSAALLTVEGLTDAIAIAGGGEPNSTGFTCALQSSGAIRCWGSNNQGQLGGGADASISPTGGVVNADAAAAAIDLGHRHGCMIDTAGALRCWGGTNSFGERGNPALSIVPLPTDAGLASLSMGFFSSCVLSHAGEVICFGNNSGGQVNPFQDASTSTAKVIDAGGPAWAIAAATSFTCAALDGGVSCWGTNAGSQQGRPGNATFNAPNSPAFTPGIAPLQAVGGGTHACAIMADRSVTCWGSNSRGQAGDFTGKTVVNTPSGVGGVAKIVQLALGHEHVCALDDDGQIRCWGGNTKGQLGPNAVPAEGGVDNTAHPDPVSVPLQ